MSEQRALVPRGAKTAADSGMVTAYRPAAHEKPQAQNWIQRIYTIFQRWRKVPTPDQTTEQGAASAASPTTYQMATYQQRYDRRTQIAECREIEASEPRAHKAIAFYAAEVCRDGVTISINGDQPEGAERYSGAAKVFENLQRIMNTDTLEGWMKMGLTEGEGFYQAIVGPDNDIVDIKRMPTSSMERCTDDADEFIDPAKAFEQVDTTTNATIAPFPLALMHHERWDHVDGERYGRPELLSIRKQRRDLQINEEAQMIRRITRATQQRLWNVGTKEVPADPEQVESIREENGFVGGKLEIWDPTNVARDYWANGQLSCEILEADSSVHEIDDINYMQELYTSALPTPAPMYGLQAAKVNRDTLSTMHDQWLKQVHRGEDYLLGIIYWAIELGLLLKGILPETVQYEAILSESTVEKPTEIQARIVEAVQNELMPRKRAVQALASIYKWKDPDQVWRELEEERKQNMQDQLALQGGSSPLPAEKATAQPQVKGPRIQAVKGNTPIKPRQRTPEEVQGYAAGRGGTAAKYNSVYGEMPPATEEDTA